MTKTAKNGIKKYRNYYPCSIEDTTYSHKVKHRNRSIKLSFLPKTVTKYGGTHR